MAGRIVVTSGEILDLGARRVGLLEPALIRIAAQPGLAEIAGDLERIGASATAITTAPLAELVSLFCAFDHHVFMVGDLAVSVAVISRWLNFRFFRLAIRDGQNVLRINIRIHPRAGLGRALCLWHRLSLWVRR